MRFFVRRLLLPAVFLTSFAAGPVLAQVDSREGIALQNEIYQLRQMVQTLQDQVARGGVSRGPASSAPPPSTGSGDLVAQLLTRVNSLEDQVRQLRGQIEETQNQQQVQNADLSKRIDDLSFQMNNSGTMAPPAAGRAAGTGSLPPPLPTGTLYPPSSPSGQMMPPPPAVPPPLPQAGPRTPEMILQDGNAAMGRRDYAKAEADAREVLANRTSPRAYDAQLLLAEALAGERQNAQAAIAFDDAYNRSRKGTHAQDALLGLANSLAAINEKKAACDTLVRLRTEFPQPRPDIREGATAAKQRIGCV